MAEDVDDAKEDGAETDEAGGEAKKGGMKKLILFIGLPVVILLLAGVAGGLMFLGGGDETEIAEAGPDGHDSEGEGGEHGGAPQASDFYEHAENRQFSMTVNISGPDGRTLSMVLEFAVVFTDSEIGALLDNEQVNLRLTATINEFLRTLRVEDLDGSMGNFRVKAEMLRRTNLVIAPLSADDVLILNMIMG
ncbi:MAG: flagellar basal body-associated FliL family protein [Oceanicaulis sp.]